MRRPARLRGRADTTLSAAVRPENARTSAAVMGALAAVLIVLQLVNTVTGYALNHSLGLISRQLGGLDGILFAPLLHGGWGHLFGNLTMLILLGALLFVAGLREFLVTTALVWVVGGLGVWLLGPSNTVTVGSSILVFGWLAYLIARGLFTRNVWQLLIGAVLALLYWGVLWSGIVSTAWADVVGTTGISWQGHLMGAVGGVLAAVVLGRRVQRRLDSRRRWSGPVI